MKVITLIICSFQVCNYLQAQSSISTMNDTLIARFNRGDYLSFYAMGSDEWKKNNKPDNIAGWLNYIKDLGGIVINSSRDHASGDSSWFTWNGQKKMISFILKVSSGDHFDGFDFRDYHLSAALIFSQNIPTDNPLHSHLDSCVHQVTIDFMVTHKLIGLSVGIAKKGRKYCYNYGTLEKGKSRLPTPQSTFELASVTKTFTGILLAKAVLDKKLLLSEDVRKYLPGEFPNLQYKGSPIRIVDLANHTSGLPAEVPNLDTFSNSFDVLKMYDSYTDDHFFADVRNVKIDTLSGVVYHYSNVGVKMLGIILEKVYGLSYAQLLQKFICKPMSMKNTRIAMPVSDTLNYTKGYDGLGNTMPHLNFNMFGGAGSILSTCDDMLNYVRGNISEQMNAVRLSHQQNFSNEDGAMGLCWQISPKTINGKKIWKSGGALGFRSYCAVIPGKNIGMIWLSNRSDIMEDELSQMSDKLFQMILSK